MFSVVTHLTQNHFHFKLLWKLSHQISIIIVGPIIITFKKLLACLLN